jgi:hypothetical protein
LSGSTRKNMSDSNSIDVRHVLAEAGSHVWRMKDGKAIEFREYHGDEQREDRFWS